MSRGPVREALNALAAMNIVELSPQRGAQVRVLRIEEAIDTLVVAQTLIGLSARLAAANSHRPEARKRLKSALRALEDFPPDSTSAEFAAARDSFYGGVNAMAGNIELKRVMPTVLIHLVRVQFRSVLRANDSTRHRDYLRMATAILAGKPKEAEKAARVHLARAIRSLSRFKTEG